MKKETNRDKQSGTDDKRRAGIYEKLKSYFDATPMSKVFNDWKRSAKYDEVGPTIDEFVRSNDGQETVLKTKRKSKSELEAMNVDRLLRYYRAERKRWYVARSSYYWDTDNVDFLWDHEEGYEKEKALFDEWQKYLSLIKEVLSTKENVAPDR